jgi:tRNA/rRNA methyltransferase
VRAGYILEQAKVHRSLAEALDGCTLVVGTTSVGHRDLHVPLYTLETAGSALRQHVQSSSAALLFGSEKFGLSNEDLSYCQWLLRIPARQEHGSMNLGQAVAICLYELIRSEAGAAELHPAPQVADGAQLERITETFWAILSRSGYTQEKTKESSLLKLRRLIRTLSIPATDAETWMGMLRQILWKVNRQPADAGDENRSEPETPPQTRAADSH